MRTRSGFTLVELLVVIAVIAILAALVISAVSTARKKSLLTQCQNNMREIGRAIISYQDEQRLRENVFPGRLTHLAVASRGGVLASREKNIFICPFDQSRGTGGTNRHPSWTDLEAINAAEPLPCSYLYEPSETPFTELGWLTPDMTLSASPTWADYKAEQQRHGNIDGRAFAPADMPIVRCYHFREWSATVSENLVEEVVNLAFDSSTVFLSIPYWEHQANPDFPLP